MSNTERENRPRFTIYGEANGNVTIEGPFTSEQGKDLCYRMIAMAIIALTQVEIKPKPNIQVVRSMPPIRGNRTQ